MKKLLIPLLLLCLSAGLHAQNYQLQNAYDFYQLHLQKERISNPQLTENDIQGSPYADKEFKEGFLVTTSNQKYVGLQFRYNIYNDQIEYKDQSGSPMAFTYAEVIDHVMIGDVKYVYSPYGILKKIEKGFFRVAEEGKASLYIRSKIFFQEAQPAGAYKDPEPPKFLNKPDEFYIRVKPSEARKVGNKNELAALFPDKQAELEAFIKKNKTKTNSTESLAELIKYYNSLQ